MVSRSEAQPQRPKIAVFSGPTATIQNSEPLVTSNKARKKYGLPPRANPDGGPARFDALRPQRLAAPVTVYVEQFSAHPLERDAAELYGPPDGYISPDGVFRKQAQAPGDTPVYEITLLPEDGLYPLPYMARQANGAPWDDDEAYPLAPANFCRQPFYPDASRIFEEIDRLAIGHQGTARYTGAIWLEGSPNIEESIYWLNLLIDTPAPIVGNASQRPHGSIGNDGDLNIVHSVEYLTSRVWADENGCDAIGAVVIQEKQIFTARDVQKADARAGGYVATGEHGGIIGSMGNSGPAILMFRPVKRHTHKSAVNINRLPGTVEGVLRIDGTVRMVPVQIKDVQGKLLSTAIPKVTIAKTARYLSESPEADPQTEVEIFARMEKNLRDFPLAGFVAEGVSPYGNLVESLSAAVKRVVLSGMPVVRVGRGNAEGFTKPPSPTELIISGSNLTATKARLLLMACLMKFGSLPPAADMEHPTEAEIRAIKAKLTEYQAVFDTH
jgi:L-asparaginase/Glu-tRNA(Gln) amidotransferase subunit D